MVDGKRQNRRSRMETQVVRCRNQGSERGWFLPYRVDRRTETNSEIQRSVRKPLSHMIFGPTTDDPQTKSDSPHRQNMDDKSATASHTNVSKNLLFNKTIRVTYLHNL